MKTYTYRTDMKVYTYRSEGEAKRRMAEARAAAEEVIEALEAEEAS